MSSIDERSREALAVLESGEIDELIAICDEDIVISPLIAGVEGGPYRGHEGVRLWFAQLVDSFDERSTEVASIELLSESTGLAEVRLRLRGRASGIDIDQTVFGAALFRSDLLGWWGFYEDREQALLGLEEAK